jgi:hypothetical protein
MATGVERNEDSPPLLPHEHEIGPRQSEVSNQVEFGDFRRKGVQAFALRLGEDAARHLVLLLSPPEQSRPRLADFLFKLRNLSPRITHAGAIVRDMQCSGFRSCQRARSNRSFPPGIFKPQP